VYIGVKKTKKLKSNFVQCNMRAGARHGLWHGLELAAIALWLDLRPLDCNRMFYI
jgi:hypothetical protein